MTIVVVVVVVAIAPANSLLHRNVDPQSVGQLWLQQLFALSNAHSRTDDQVKQGFEDLRGKGEQRERVKACPFSGVGAPPRVMLVMPLPCDANAVPDREGLGVHPLWGRGATSRNARCTTSM